MALKSRRRGGGGGRPRRTEAKRRTDGADGAAFAPLHSRCLAARARARVWRMRLWVLGHHKRRVAPPITLYMYVFDIYRKGLAADCERDLAGLVACLLPVLDCLRPTTRIKPSTGLDSDPEGFKKRYKIRFDRISGLSRVFQRVQPPTACALLRAARLLRASAAALPLLGPPALACSAAVGAGGRGLKSRQAGSVRRARGSFLSSPSSPLQRAAHVLEQAGVPSLSSFCCSRNALGFTLVST